MTPLPFAAEIPDYLLVPIKILALIGAAAAGGFAASWTTRAIVKLSFGQNVPDKLAWFVRALGFVACGLLAYFWLFGGGGGGIGGGGNGLFGTGGKDGGPKDAVAKKDDSSRKEQDGRKKEEPPVPPDETMRIEVLGDDALRRLAGPSFDAARRYRILGKPELLTLRQSEDAILKRRSGKPGLRRVEVLLYGDSPDRKRPQVAMLEAWIKDISEPAYPLSVRVSDEEGNAP